MGRAREASRDHGRHSSIEETAHTHLAACQLSRILVFSRPHSLSAFIEPSEAFPGVSAQVGCSPGLGLPRWVLTQIPANFLQSFARRGLQKLFLEKFRSVGERSKIFMATRTVFLGAQGWWRTWSSYGTVTERRILRQRVLWQRHGGCRPEDRLHLLSALFYPWQPSAPKFVHAHLDL
jgi:hypothetical protein